MKNKVLIVDDEADVLTLLEERLSVNGYDVIKAYNGADAIKLAKSHKPNLIIMDIMMPGMDGSKAAQALRDDPDTKNIPLMFLTCLLTADEAKTSMCETGGHFFVAKPYNVQELLKEIRRHIV